jgi:hypothetical protein
MVYFAIIGKTPNKTCLKFDLSILWRPKDGLYLQRIKLVKFVFFGVKYKLSKEDYTRLTALQNSYDALRTECTFPL